MESYALLSLEVLLLALSRILLDLSKLSYVSIVCSFFPFIRVVFHGIDTLPFV